MTTELKAISITHVLIGAIDKDEIRKLYPAYRVHKVLEAIDITVENYHEHRCASCGKDFDLFHNIIGCSVIHLWELDVSFIVICCYHCHDQKTMSKTAKSYLDYILGVIKEASKPPEFGSVIILQRTAMK